MEWIALTRRRPDARTLLDVEFGRVVAERLAPFGVTRSIHVKNRTVLAVETTEGLVDAIRRSGTICHGGFSVILDFAPSAGAGEFPDEPVNSRVFQAMIDAGARTLAIKKGWPLAERAVNLALADRQKIAVIEMGE